MIPVTTNIRTIHPMILPRRLTSVIWATVEEMAKKTSGTTIVNNRLRKMSPRGLRTAAFDFISAPTNEPTAMDAIRRIEKR